MDHGIIMHNSFGVKIRIKTCSTPPSFVNSGIIPTQVHSEIDLRAQKQANHKVFEKTKLYLNYVLLLPIWLSKKVGRLFLTNPYQYPMFPFHFPILIYGPYHSVGYYPDTHLLESFSYEDLRNLDSEGCL
ncbi:hypothetical protein [Bacillus horti]|uniref:Uncharacterized protein n=2 Tax=Caldalkalibacillus horti TaxID=77523 RepID=A0ABT9VTY8_9BACI|nr:hypothetical protein [Bacillus horti]MDQ0164344.1 hypothetical protein [Bacillus horti]